MYYLKVRFLHQPPGVHPSSTCWRPTLPICRWTHHYKSLFCFTRYFPFCKSTVRKWSNHILPPLTTRDGHKPLLVCGRRLAVLEERTCPLLKPGGEKLFRFGNYFVTDDGKATIKTVVGDEKVPTVIFPPGLCNPLHKQRSLHTTTIARRPWWRFKLPWSLLYDRSNIAWKSAESTTLTEKIRAILLPKNGGGDTRSSQQLVRYHVHDMCPSVHDAWLVSRKMHVATYSIWDSIVRYYHQILWFYDFTR